MPLLCARPAELNSGDFREKPAFPLRYGFRFATSGGGILAPISSSSTILKPDEALSESLRKAVNQWFDHAA
jgi:hypothetical protein